MANTYEEYHAIINGKTPPHNAYNSVNELLADIQGETLPVYIKKVVYTETIVAVYNVDPNSPLPTVTNQYVYTDNVLSRNKRDTTAAPGPAGSPTA